MRIDVDVTKAGISDGDYVGQVLKLEMQAKANESDKWNKEGTINVSTPEDFSAFPAENKRLHYTIHIPEKGNIWHDLYLKETALGFLKSFLTATGVNFTKEGFDPNDAVGRNIGIRVATIESPGYSPKTQITKVWKA